MLVRSIIGCFDEVMYGRYNFKSWRFFRLGFCTVACARYCLINLYEHISINWVISIKKGASRQVFKQ